MLDADAADAHLRRTRFGRQDRYLAMYSSWLEGIVTDPAWMVVPVDDHLVHRGDGVFETCKMVGGAIYNLPAHLARLRYSAEVVGLAPAPAEPWLSEAIRQTARASGRTDCHLRILLGRGPGSLGANPYDCPVPACYIIAYASPHIDPQTYARGVAALESVLPAKPGPLARIKSCNYLQNALMKKEAADLGVDFVLGFDATGHLAECATESVGIVDPQGGLRFPEPHSILDGTTMQRVLELARDRPDAAGVTSVQRMPISREAVRQASEILIVGTTMDVLPVSRYGGQPVGDGIPGPVGAALRRLLREDIECNPRMRTPVYDV